ncbi:type VII secretion protein EccCa [Demequina sp. NBRC 110055]|uniref:type VII secretion protein EccCa n=1 Tax=Demequina sp. NBRC 110055 TaxID=1570344 RepID=UPI0009FD27E5|nr:type VII secretion protein EccCa [Demequina sp. NBRC 110055]
MTSQLVHRPGRETRPLEQPEARTLAAPPPLGDAPPGGLPLQSLLPVIGSLSSITMMVVLRGNPVMVIVGAMILVVALVGGVGMAVSSRGRQVRQRRLARERYLDYLERVRSEVRSERTEVRDEARLLDPAPVDLADVIRNPARLWERRRGDEDFLRLRVGEGVVPWFGLAMPEEHDPVQPHDPMMVRAGQQVCELYSAIGGMPMVASLAGAAAVTIVAPREQGRALARAILAQTAALHAPTDVSLALASPPEARTEWDGFDLLPHAALDGQWDGPILARRVGAGAAEVLATMADDVTARTAFASGRRAGERAPFGALLVVEDYHEGATAPLALPGGVAARTAGLIHLSLVESRLDEPSDTDVRLTVTVEADGPRLTVEWPDDPDQPTVSARPDSLSPAVFAALCSALAPRRLSVVSRAEGGTGGTVGPLDLLGVAAVEELSPARWATHAGPRFLRVGVGSDDLGNAVEIDLKEGAQGGMGPHGICIGATGSGKSEFLRTLVLGLAGQHSPEDLAMILVDYKGGAAFAPLAPLPHVSGLIDNLEGESGLVERARASIAGEVVRRQRQLKEAGSLASITEYRRARAVNPHLAPMPHLFVVIDEFGELLTAEPEFVDLLLTIGRIGRSIGVHMLLSSQRIESGKLRGLDTYLSYRIGLRTFSESESQVVLNTVDAFHLPPEPGWGFLKVDTTVYTRFRSGYVSGPTPGPIELDTDEPAFAVPLPASNSLAAVLQGREESSATRATPDAPRPPLVEEAVARLRKDVPPVASVWLPPLPERLALFDVLDSHHREPLQVPLGLIDDPARQFQGSWRIDLDANGGHHAVIGAPQSGRTTFLRAFAAGIATTHTPAQVTMYGLDLAGAGLARLEGFPHVGGIVTRHRAEQHLRLLEELHAMLAERERLFREMAIESMAHWRAVHAAGRLPTVISPDVVLLVDGYGLVRTDFDHLEAPMADLLTRGGSFGIHVVMSLTRWAEVPMRHQPLIGNKVELRLNDPTESTIARKLAETVKRPGRALTAAKLFAQVAIPRIDDGPEENAGEALTALAQRTAADWRGPAAAPIRLLPDILAPSTLPGVFDEPDRIPLGLRQDTMSPEMLDLAGADPHLLVLGDPGSGKTAVLRRIIVGLTERHGPDEMVIALMEPRGTLAAELDDDYLGGHATSGPRARELAAAVAQELAKRRDGQSSAAMRVVVIADDFDILSAGNSAPLEPLLPFLPQARDLGLSVILTRPVAGASRALYDSTMQTVRDVGATGLLLSGERSEGALWPGVYAGAAIPGRARIIRRAQPPRLMQVAFDEPGSDSKGADA